MSRLSNITHVIEELLPSNSQQLITAQVLRNCLNKILLTDQVSVDNVKADTQNILSVSPFDSDLTYSKDDLVLKDAKIYQFIRTHSGEWSSNDVEEVTLQSLLNKHVLYNGTITPSQQPIKSPFCIMYLATTPGTYTNMANITIQDGELAFIIQRNNNYTKQTITTLTQTIGNSRVHSMSQYAITQESYKHPYTSKTKTSINSDITTAVQHGSREY